MSPRIDLATGDITREAVDAIVNAAAPVCCLCQQDDGSPVESLTQKLLVTLAAASG